MIDASSACDGSDPADCILQDSGNMQQRSLQLVNCHCRSGSDFCLKLVHAPLVDTVEELDGVEETNIHLIALDPPFLCLRLFGLGVMKLLDLRVKPQPLGGQQLAGPVTQLLNPEIIS